MVFYSKSAELDRIAKARADRLNPTIVNINNVYRFVCYVGNSIKNRFGFTCVDLSDKDLSIIISAKVIVFNRAILNLKTLSMINIAVEYGVPVIWNSIYIPPDNLVWNIDLQMNAKDDGELWRGICSLAK